MKKTHNDEQLPGIRRGYYLLYRGALHWFAETFQEARWRIHACCERVLRDDHPYYEVRYSLGVDVQGRPAWTNLDHSDSLLP